MHQSLLLLTNLALGLCAPADNQGSVVSVSLTRYQGAEAQRSSQSAGKQFATAPDSLQNLVVQYIAELDVGTPPQKVKAALDTGSSDLWVYSQSADPSSGFSEKNSSSFKMVDQGGFSIQYVSGEASGDWVKDTVSLGGSTVKGQQFAVVGQQEQGSDYGVFGIGRTSGETNQKPAEYDNFPASLKKSGQIDRLAYSLYLDNVNASSGTILFGGIDTSKFDGPLYTVPFTDPVSLEVAFTVAGGSYNGILDSGTSFTYLPSEVFAKLQAEHGWNLQYDASQQIFYSPTEPTGDGVTYDFSGIKITVPLNEVFIPISGRKYALTILSTNASQGIVLLGDSTLRSAYVVYDLEGNRAGLAQASFSNKPSNIEAITADGIPGAKPAPQASGSTPASAASSAPSATSGSGGNSGSSALPGIPGFTDSGSSNNGQNGLLNGLGELLLPGIFL